jgi:hypothetical protein
VDWSSQATLARRRKEIYFFDLVLTFIQARVKLQASTRVKAEHQLTIVSN